MPVRSIIDAYARAADALPVRDRGARGDPRDARAASRRRTSRRTAPRGRRPRSSRASCTARPRRAGILGIGYPEAIGGQGGDLGHVLVACDELILAGPLGRHGGRARQPRHRAAADRPVRHAASRSERFVPPCLRDGKIAALAITEPGGGSDVAALATRAVRDGDHYVVNGAKTFITSGSRADFVTTRGAHRRRRATAASRCS